MSFDARLRNLLGRLRSAKTFEVAARALLEAVLESATAAMAASTPAWRGRVSRAAVHLRPQDGYRTLVICGDDGDGSRGPTVSHVPSATAWRWLSAHRRPVQLDVNLGLVQVHGEANTAISEPESVESFDSKESLTRLLARDVTHLFALPLRSPGDQLDGMVSVEADCRAATGAPFIWPACATELEALVEVASPYLAALPHASTTVSSDPLLPVVGPSMAPVVQTLGVFATQEETLLLCGPTGSGKSRLARWSHERSSRKSAPFESLDLATIPEELQMAELFGWRKGAFTGAQRDTPGAVTRAQAGTLFIDEVDKLSLRAQAGLLRVLEDRRYRPLGDGASERDADVRFVVGTSTPLQNVVSSGTFRADLYYRINVLPVRVPPLGERLDEVVPWAQYMLERRHGAATAGRTAKLAGEAEHLLCRQRWPGNLRQLDNIVRRAYALSLTETVAHPDHLVLRAHHIERALALEDPSNKSTVFDLMRSAATAFVLEAQRLQANGEPLSLDLAAAFQGFVLEAAVQHAGSQEAALLLLGKKSSVDNRNHHKLIRQELQRMKELADRLGEPAPSEIGTSSQKG